MNILLPNISFVDIVLLRGHCPAYNITAYNITALSFIKLLASLVDNDFYDQTFS